MAGCCGDQEEYKRKAGIAALVGIALIASLIGLTWLNAHPELFRRHRDFTAPQVNESHPMSHVAVDRS